MPKIIRLSTTHHFIMKIPNIRKLQQIASNHSSDFNLKDLMKLYKGYTKDFIKLYKNYTKEPYSF